LHILYQKDLPSQHEALPSLSGKGMAREALIFLHKNFFSAMIALFENFFGKRGKFHIKPPLFDAKKESFSLEIGWMVTFS
jgi:hypothetical protein